MGVTGWTPDVFWNALFTDTMIAVEGIAMANGAEMPDEASERHQAQLAELEKLIERYG